MEGAFTFSVISTLLISLKISQIFKAFVHFSPELHNRYMKTK